MRFLLLGTLLIIAACGSREETKPSTTTTPVVEAPTKQPPADVHRHNHGNQKTITETITLAGVTLRVAAQGTLKPNSEYHLEIALIEGIPGATVRLWIGESDGIGSMKTKADGHGDHYHAHVQSPAQINDKTALWIKVQTIKGDIGIGSIALK